jgi:DNA mismatch repair protein MutS
MKGSQKGLKDIHLTSILYVMSEQTPIMKQYMKIKSQNPEAILLFRMGDFYEMFGEDARIASSILQIALTSREKNKDDPLPMCGMPHFASERYIDKLIKAGYKVAVCEQTGDPKASKGIVDREVVQVITPGTHTPENPKENNYLMAVFPSGEFHGIAVADVSTGEFIIYETTRPLEDEVTRYSPSEVILPESLLDDIHYSELFTGYYLSTLSDWSFDFTDAYRTMLAHFKVASLEGFGCEGLNAAISAGGGLLTYLEGASKEPPRFRRISSPNQRSYMFLDAPTQRNLELVSNLKDGGIEGSLLWAMDETLTPMGGRFLRGAILRPLIDIDKIRMRHGAINYMIEDYELIDILRSRLRHVQDLERLAQKVDSESANARDIIAVHNTISILPKLKKALTACHEEHLKTLALEIEDMGELEGLIEKSINEQPPQTLKEGGIIKDGYNAEVDELRSLSGNAKDFIAGIEAEERKKTGISTLKVGYNRIHGYFIEVTKSNLDLVPYHYTRKQTLVGGERYIIPELKEYESKVLGAEEKLKALEFKVFKDILAEANKFSPLLSRAASALAEADFLLSLAVVAKRNNYVKPTMLDDFTIEITNGRHPVIEKMQLGEKFIPNDTSMDGEHHRLMILTGPNMAGKSTYMRQVALICLLAQSGGFVPAEKATIGIADRIFTRIGASDYLTRGQSTFMVEMVETANILNNATDRSLILLDEVGRGTSTFDGISIAWATAEFISKAIRARTLFATHYNELTDLSHKFEGIKNYNIVVREWGDEIIFLRKIEPGPADKSYGIQVARLAGLPDIVVDKAREVLKTLEKQHLSTPQMNNNQLDLFSAGRESVFNELMEIDTSLLSGEDLATFIKDLQRKGRMNL